LNQHFVAIKEFN